MKKIIIFIASFTFVPFVVSEILKEYFLIERSIIWCLCSISFLGLYIILPLLDKYIKTPTKYMRCVWFLILYLIFVISLLSFLS